MGKKEIEMPAEEMSQEDVRNLLAGKHVPQRPAKRDAGDLTQLVIELPLPGPGCKPNSHAIWQVRYKSQQLLREAAHFAGISALNKAGRHPPRWERATAEATFHKPGSRAKVADGDNLNASLKAAFDGLQDAGIIVNDSGLTVLPPRQLIGDAAAEAMVVLVITKVPEPVYLNELIAADGGGGEFC